jgi:Ca-activated chloride channel family protein
MPEREAISIPERKANADHSNELFNIRLRYKQPDSDKSVKLELPVSKPEKIETASSDFRFAAAVAMFGQILTRSEFCVNSSLDEVIALAKTALDPDISGYRREFVRLVEIAKEL